MKASAERARSSPCPDCPWRRSAVFSPSNDETHRLPETSGMSKSAGECFLCGEEGKVKRFTFYSGERKGGSRTELLSATVTVSEWWNDLRMHEAHVCRECQERMWAEHVKWPPILCGIGAAVLLALAVPI